ncbi:MAG: transporter substrate-binding domain-containing protein [Candidatus Thorarchaeota archaeon]|jgi:hypothetical protein
MTSHVLQEVQERGFLRCGVPPYDIDGWRYLGPGGKFEGFDVDFCKALAVAILKKDTQVEYVVPADWPDRFTLLQDGDADVIFAVATLTAARDSELRVDFPAVYYYEVTDFTEPPDPEKVTDALGPVVAHGDQQWADIVRWVVYGMITAEELGVDSRNVHRMAANPPNARVASLLGKEGDVGVKLGLRNDFMVNVIFKVGNYGEVYDRHMESFNRREGSLNALWTEGGILFASSRP